jgi:hypothetical protein
MGYLTGSPRGNLAHEAGSGPVYLKPSNLHINLALASLMRPSCKLHGAFIDASEDMGHFGWHEPSVTTRIGFPWRKHA